MKTKLISFHLETTYDGLYTSRESLSAVDVEGIVRARAEGYWGKGRPTLLKMEGFGTARYTCSVQLEGPIPEGDMEYSGTELCVIWFADRPPEDPHISAIARVGKDWDALSRPFSY